MNPVCEHLFGGRGGVKFFLVAGRLHGASPVLHFFIYLNRLYCVLLGLVSVSSLEDVKPGSPTIRFQKGLRSWALAALRGFKV